MSDETEAVLVPFPAEVYVTYLQDGEEFYPQIAEDLQDVDVEEASGGRCAVYKLVREGTVTFTPGTNKFKSSKGAK
jgi:hypothetical protein